MLQYYNMLIMKKLERKVNRLTTLMFGHASVLKKRILKLELNLKLLININSLQAQSKTDSTKKFHQPRFVKSML